MATTILIIGEKFRYADAFLAYLTREATHKIGNIDTFLFLKENNPNIIVEFESHLDKASHILIAAAKQSFALIGKMIATHLSDTLIVKNDMLVPSKTTQTASNSYLVTVRGKPVNVIDIESGVLPSILIESHTKIQKAFILDTDQESVRLLATPAAQTSEVMISILPQPGGYTEIIAEEKKYGKIENFFANLSKLYGKKAIVSSSLETYLVKTLHTKNLTVAVSESCTGGLLSYAFTGIPGASEIFIGSLTTYINEAKTSWLGVDEQILAQFGAVSEPTISAMLEGTLQLSGADYALATSGIAGPGGGTPDNPVGTVYVGVKHKSGIKKIERHVFSGDRRYIQSSATASALRLLCEILE